MTIQIEPGVYVNNMKNKIGPVTHLLLVSQLRFEVLFHYFPVYDSIY